MEYFKGEIVKQVFNEEMYQMILSNPYFLNSEVMFEDELVNNLNNID